MKTYLENSGGVDYLSFKPKGMEYLTMLPVITKGSRDDSNAWTWNGDSEKPTLRPSIRSEYTNKEGKIVVIHYWLNDGLCQCLSDCTDGNAGKLLDLAEL